MGYLVTVKQGGHTPRSTRNVPGARGPCGGPGLEPRRWCWRGGIWLPRVTGRCRCHGVQVRSVWRVHQLQTLPQNSESTVEEVARSWFMFGADLVWQNDLQGCRWVWSLCCRAQQSCPAMGSRMGTHTSLPGVEQSELGLGGDSRARPGRSSTGSDPKGLCWFSLCLSCHSLKEQRPWP